jgi:hypothetical protein
MPAEIPTTKMWLPLGSLCIGVVLGSLLTVFIANLWPRIGIAPDLFQEDDVRFGRTTSGRPALCQSNGMALVPSGSRGFAHPLPDSTCVPEKEVYND